MTKSELKDLIAECMCEAIYEDDEYYDESFKQMIKDALKDWNKSTGSLRNTLNTDLNADVGEFWGNIKKDYKRNKLDRRIGSANKVKFNDKDYATNRIKLAVETFISHRMEEYNCTMTTAKKDLHRIIDRICDDLE